MNPIPGLVSRLLNSLTENHKRHLEHQYSLKLLDERLGDLRKMIQEFGSVAQTLNQRLLVIEIWRQSLSDGEIQTPKIKKLVGSRTGEKAGTAIELAVTSSGASLKRRAKDGKSKSKKLLPPPSV